MGQKPGIVREEALCSDWLYGVCSAGNPLLYLQSAICNMEGNNQPHTLTCMFTAAMAEELNK